VPIYAELFPAELARLWAEGSPAIIPWGALEWHGNHLPLGLDGFLADHFCRQLAERVNGVCLPTVWLPITTLPHHASQSVQTGTLRLILDDMIASLVQSGARRIALITGHCAQGHLAELYEAALRGMDDHNDVLIFAGAQLQPLGRPETMDHAARYETSQFLDLRPDLVCLDVLPPHIEAQRDGILGEDPRLATAAEGRALTLGALERWATWFSTADRPGLESYYREAFDTLQSYVDAYYTDSWDEALLNWWAAK